MSYKFKKYKKIYTLILTGVFSGLLAFLSIKDTKDFHILSVGEKVMADVPASADPYTSNSGDASSGDGSDSGDGSFDYHY